MSNVLEEKKKKYEVSDEVKSVGEKIITEKSLSVSPARIKYVKVYPNINKKTAGRCMLARPMLKLFGDCDYIIQISGELWDALDDKRKDILMWHELLHILPVMNDKTGEWNFKIRDHDITDFYAIIKSEGIDWFSELKDLHASVYDLEPSEIDGFNL